jgi:hypothetical protein
MSVNVMAILLFKTLRFFKVRKVNVGSAFCGTIRVTLPVLSFSQKDLSALIVGYQPNHNPSLRQCYDLFHIWGVKTFSEGL